MTSLPVVQCCAPLGSASLSEDEQMAERLKRAAAWLGLVTDDRYADYDDDGTERTEGISRDELDGLLRGEFECVEDAEVADSIPVFAGKERWMVWKRK